MRLRLCMVGLAAVLIAACGSETREASATADRPPVILISIDTLRADRLPAWGYTAVETPAIDALRRDSVLFSRAYSHSPLTLPSHVSLLTGLLPPVHGVRNNLGYRFDPSRYEALPEVLRDAGYATGAAVSSYVLRGETGLGALFDDYDDAIAVVPGRAAGQLQRRGEDTAAAGLRWIDGHQSQPSFFFLHLFEPHSPYEAPEPYRSRFADPYDAEIAHADAIVGRFIDGLKQRGIYDRAVIILLSDHGEGLMDHGEAEHGVFLYREAIHVPLLLKLPRAKSAGTTRNEPVQLADIMPTVVALIGATARAGAGRSLLEEVAEPREIFSETMYPRIHLGWSELRSLISGDRHFIQAPDPELYDLAADPRERKNLAAMDRRLLSRLRKAIEKHSTPLEAPTTITPEDAAGLKALGYISAPAAAASGPLPDPKERIAALGLLGKAEGMHQSGDSRAAISLLEDVIAQNPRFTDALSQLARTYSESGELEKAIQIRQRILTAAPSLAGEVSLALAADYLMLGDFGNAESHAKLALSGNAPASHLLIGRAHLARHDLPAAEREARGAMAVESYSLPATVLLAQVWVAEGRHRYAEALGVLDAARARVESEELEPVPLLEYARGDVLARTGRPVEAEEAFRSEIALFPRNREAYAALAVTQILRGDAAGAEVTFGELARKNPHRSSFSLAAQTFRRFGLSAQAARWERRSRASR